MFSLSISASVILGTDVFAEPNASASTALSRDAQTDASLLTLSVVPSRRRRWAIDLLGPGAAEPHDTFDIRVGWGDGGYSELLGVPLDSKDTLVLDRNSEVSIYGVFDDVIFPRS